MMQVQVQGRGGRGRRGGGCMVGWRVFANLRSHRHAQMQHGSERLCSWCSSLFQPSIENCQIVRWRSTVPRSCPDVQCPPLTRLLRIMLQLILRLNASDVTCSVCFFVCSCCSCVSKEFSYTRWTRTHTHLHKLYFLFYFLIINHK